MRGERLRIYGALILAGGLWLAGAHSLAAQAKPIPGKLAGIVRDSAGVPQMGASVELIAEENGLSASRDFLTNTQGVFRGEKLAPGFYTLRVTLAGFLPTLEKHIRIASNLTTVVRVQLESMFASLDQLRRTPASGTADPDDWKWVLRSASNMRPVLEWMDQGSQQGLSASTETVKGEVTRARLEFTDGARHPGSVSNLPSAPATSFAYDQKLGETSRLLLAGEMGYEGDSPSGGVATVWLPTGSIGAGPHTALVLREAKVGPDGPAFRGIRADQGGAFALGDRTEVQYGAEYVLVGLGAAASSLRPRAQLKYRVSDDWTAEVVFASLPSGPEPLEGSDAIAGGALAAAVDELDAFPALLWRDGHPLLQNGWHEEVAAERKVGANGRLQVAAFHEDDRNVAVFGRGSNLPGSDYFLDYFSNGFAYDGGASSSWGTRLAWQQKLAGGTELTALYSFGGVLAPSGLMTDGILRDLLRTVPRHGLGAGISGTVPRLQTRLQVAYKWLSGTAVSRLDSYGESNFQMDPYLHVELHQPLPRFALGRWEAIADCDNLLAQGYVSVASRDGRVTLVPAFRTFRGGLSVQF